MVENKALGKAKIAKNDEFYTKIADIERELNHYKEHFKGKTVFCNCDDPEYSNFWKYFHLNFEHLGLKKLITTHYDANVPTYMMSYEGGNDTDISVGVVTPLKQNGDFRSPESIEMLNASDIVVTNPPFSLYREYVGQLMSYDKKFLIIGNMNAMHYKEIFHYIQENELWLGFNSVKEFVQPDGKVKKFGNVLWMTNLDISKRHEPMDLIEHYTPEKYPVYDNFNAINVDRVLDIPVDYDGIMGVPDGFINSYNPDQFEIVGRSGDTDWVLNECDFFTPPSTEKQSEYKKYSKTWRVQNAYLLDDKGLPIVTYSRIFIRRKRKG